MVKSHDGRSYQLSNSGVSFIFSNDPKTKHKRQNELEPSRQSTNQLSLSVSQCPRVAAKPDPMCVNRTSNCWSQGHQDVDCPGFALCCFDGCVASCLDSQQSEVARLQAADQAGSCPVVEDKPASQCTNATANCWSRGVADVDCPDYGLCCYDGCVNTCLTDTQQDLEFDQSLSEGLEDDEDLDDELDDQLDDQLDDELDDQLDEQLDEYGAPKAEPINYVSDIDTYGSPLAGPITAYKDIVENDLKTQQVGIRSKKEHSSAIVNRNAIAGVGPFLYQSGLTGLSNLEKPKKNKISLGGNKSKRNLYKTKSAFSSFKYANGIDNNKVKEYQNYKKDFQHEKSSKFRSSKQFHPIFYSGGKPWAAPVKRTESPVRNIVRKKLQLTDTNKGNNVMSTLEKLLKKHFSIFSYF